MLFFLSVQSVRSIATLANTMLAEINALPPYLDEIIQILKEAFRTYTTKCTSMVLLDSSDRKVVCVSWDLPQYKLAMGGRMSAEILLEMGVLALVDRSDEDVSRRCRC